MFGFRKKDVDFLLIPGNGYLFLAVESYVGKWVRNDSHILKMGLQWVGLSFLMFWLICVYGEILFVFFFFGWGNGQQNGGEDDGGEDKAAEEQEAGGGEADEAGHRVASSVWSGCHCSRPSTSSLYCAVLFGYRIGSRRCLCLYWTEVVFVLRKLVLGKRATLNFLVVPFYV